MKIPTYTRHGDSREAMSMTPMIDVVFLLLIFFVCASIGQTKELLLETPLSAGGVSADVAPTDREPRRDRLYLKLLRVGERTVVDQDGRIFEDLDAVYERLIGLAQLDPNIPVVIDTADDVPLGDMIALYDVCKSADYQTINFAVAHKSTRPTKPQPAQP